MKGFLKYAPWLTRLFLLLPTLIFTLIAERNIAHPVQAAGAEGMSLNSPLGVTIARVGLGGSRSVAPSSRFSACSPRAGCSRDWASSETWSACSWA